MGDDEVQYAVERKEKAWQDYKLSGKDKTIREIKKEEYEMQKHQMKVLIKMKYEKSENEKYYLYYDNEQLQGNHETFLAKN